MRGGLIVIRNFLFIFTLMLQSCGETEVESLEDIFVRSEQERAELSIVTELAVSEPIFGKFVGAETELTFQINHSKDTKNIEFYHSRYCEGEAVETLKVITERESSRIDYSEIKRNQINYFSTKSFGQHGESIGCSNTIKFLQSSDAGTLDFMIDFVAQDASCSLEGDTLDSILTNCSAINFNFESLNDVLTSPLVSLKYYNSKSCGGIQSGSHNFEDDGYQDLFSGIIEGEEDYSFKVTDQRGKDVCIDFFVNKDTTAPPAPDSFSIVEPVSLKAYENNQTVELKVEQSNPPSEGVLKIYASPDCSGSSLEEKTLSASDTTVNTVLSFASQAVGEKNLFLFLEDKIGNGSCFSALGVSYDVVAKPAVQILTASPSNGESLEVKIENQLIGSSTKVYSNSDCSGDAWIDIDPAASEDQVISNNTLAPGGRYNFSFESITSNSNSGCVNMEDTHDVLWSAPIVTSESSSVDANPNFSMMNISDQIIDGADVLVTFHPGAGCVAPALQISSYSKSQFMNVELEQEIVVQDDYLYSFTYSYDGITSKCSNIVLFSYKLPLIELVDEGGINYESDSTPDTYLKLKISSLDTMADKVITIHKDPSCLLKGYQQKFLLNNEEIYESDTLESFFLDGPKDYSLYVRYEDLGTGEAHCYEEAFVTIEFNDIDEYVDLYDLDGDGNITDVKIDSHKHYRLTSNISFDGLDFSPLSSELDPYQGHFFGNFRSFTDLSASLNSIKKLGIFEVLGEHSVVYELGFINVQIENSINSDEASTGIIAGESYGVIERVFVDSNSQVVGEDNVGALAGVVKGGTIRLATSQASVFGANNIGGLVGVLDGPEGYTQSGQYRSEFPAYSVIVNSISSGDVEGKNSVGGLVGKMHGAIGYSYSSGDVNGEEKVGGLVGEIDVREVSIEHCFSTSMVTGVSAVAGLVGLNHQTVGTNYIIKNSYHTQEICYNFNEATPTPKDFCLDDETPTKIDISELITEKTCDLLFFGCDGVFTIKAGGLPTIDYDGVSPATRDNDLGLNTGSGIRSNPLVIESVEQWLGLSNLSVHGHLHLVLSDDVTFDDDPDNHEFRPLKDRSRDYRFTGVLDGNHYSLNSLTYDQNFLNNQYYGLLIGSSLGGEVKNLHVKNSEIDAHSYTGFISSFSLGGRFNNLSFDGVTLNFGGPYYGFVSGGYSIGDIIKNVTVVNSTVLPNGTSHGSYSGLISAKSSNSSFKNIIIRDSVIKDSESISIGFTGMVLGNSGLMNQFDELSVEVDIRLQHDSQYVGGVAGWVWLNNSLKNSVVTGTIDGGVYKLGGFIGGAREIFIKNSISEITINGKSGATYCSGFVGNTYKENNPEHNSVYIENSVSIPNINCDGGVDLDDRFSPDQLNFAFNHYYHPTRMSYNFWLDSASDHIFSCYRANVSGEANAPCTNIENLNGISNPAFAPGSIEYFWDYFFFETTEKGGAEFSEDYWLDLDGGRPRVRGHPAM